MPHVEGTDVNDLLDQAFRFTETGQLGQAAALCQTILDRAPENAEANNLVGGILLSADRPSEAIRHFTVATSAEPTHPGFRSNLGETYRRLGEPEKAINQFRFVLTARPGFHSARYSISLCLIDLGRLDEAIAELTEAVRQAPEIPDYQIALAEALRDANRIDEALDAYRKISKQTPNSALAWSNIGILLRRKGMLNDAAEAHRRAIDAAPTMAEAHLNLGIALEDARNHDLAIEAYRQATKIAPDNARAFYLLGGACVQQNQSDDATEAFTQAIALRPDFYPARWGRTLALPILYESEQQITDCREQLARNLRDLDERFDPKIAGATDEAFEAVQSATNFLMHYQGQDDLGLQQDYGRLVSRILAAKFPEYAEPVDPTHRSRHQKPKIGFVSANFFSHSITKTHGRWITGLDREKFDVSSFHLGATVDQATKILQQQCDQFFHFPSFDAGVLAAIADQKLDALIYTDIGMQPVIQVLAGLRLAPLQCNGLGHPITSGMPTIDVALTSDLMEPLDGDRYYSEALVRLPNLATSYDWARIKERLATNEEENRPHGPRFLCSQSLFKLLPQFDEIFPRIAREIGKCEFWFISYMTSGTTDFFRRRIASAFSRHGLNADDFVTIHPRQDQTGFFALNQNADVLLDSCIWSGNNSSMEAIACGLPIVTLPGPFMRSRHTFAQMRMMGLEETIAVDIDDYIAIAARLGTDAIWRKHIAAQIAENRNALYDDTSPVTAFEQFLTSRIS